MLPLSSAQPFNVLRFTDNHVLSFGGQLVLDACDGYSLSDNARRLVWLLYISHQQPVGYSLLSMKRTGRVLKVAVSYHCQIVACVTGLARLA